MTDRWFHQGGADPGKKGAIARIRMDLETREAFLSVHAMPTVVVTKSGREAVSPDGVVDLIASLDLHAIVVERVFYLSGEANSSSGAFGEGRGALVTAAAALKIPRDEPPAASWKPKMAVPSDKQLARARASQLMPHCISLWPNKGSHDQAEAALLAFYGLLTRGLHPKSIKPEA